MMAAHQVEDDRPPYRSREARARPTGAWESEGAAHAGQAYTSMSRLWSPSWPVAKNGVTGGVWRVSAGERRAVLKVLTRNKEAGGRWAATDEPRHWNYWRREAHVYESGLAQVWQAYGIRAPRLLACVERADGDVALWLEDVKGGPGTSWTVGRHVEYARRLGAAQGAVGESEDGSG